MPATYQRLLKYKAVKGISRLARGSLRMMCVAGAPLDLTLKRRMEDVGIPLLNGYGMTECSPGLAGVRETRAWWERNRGALAPASNIELSTGTETGWPMARSANCMSAVSTLRGLSSRTGRTRPSRSTRRLVQHRRSGADEQ